MKTTLDLPDNLMRDVKLRAVMQGRTLRDVVADFLRQGLGQSPVGQAMAPPASSLVEIGPGGLPVIRCRADAPASQASVQELLLLEQQAQAAQDMQHAGLPV